ncbi:CoA transferase [Streptomyces sp. HU2014]|uniref:CaiB/BaiF CoA transferase family protein n=1 Tax=Streptomyces sp. HU2014 TaxID=2939414 RepID=UPI00200EFA61|nr:CoA transferase [Streptomyces sp. HU2014]UQI45358.1 CoA transferase [Streptomyces sp. HU2014]
MSRPFSGVRVLDLTHVLAGPFATYQLALLGAEVIKIEAPGRPDIARTRGPDEGLNERLRGVNYQAQGGNKRAMTLDLRTEAGREVLRRLVATADVLVENYRAGALAGLGLGPEELSAVNPSLVHCSMTGFGQRGPRARVNAYDNVIQAASGVIPRSGGRKPGVAFVDYASGYNAAFAISAALFARARDGRGQRIDCAMFDTALMLMAPSVAAELHPVTRGPAVEAGLGSYATAGGELMLGAMTPDQNRRLWRALALEGHDHPRFAEPTTSSGLRALGEEMRRVLREVFATRAAAEWEELLHGHGVPAERVRTLAEALTEEQLAHRSFLAAGAPGDPAVPVAAFSFAHDGPRWDSPAPAFGEHTDEILGELGLSTADIDGLRGAGVIA